MYTKPNKLCPVLKSVLTNIQYNTVMQCRYRGNLLLPVYRASLLRARFVPSEPCDLRAFAVVRWASLSTELGCLVRHPRCGLRELFSAESDAGLHRGHLLQSTNSSAPLHVFGMESVTMVTWTHILFIVSVTAAVNSSAQQLTLGLSSGKTCNVLNRRLRSRAINYTQWK